MKPMLTMLAVFTLVGAAWAAEKPNLDPIATTLQDEEPGSECVLTEICYDWDFAQSDHGFMPAPCDTGGAPVWGYGATAFIPGAPGNVWGTVLNGNYLNNSGEGLYSPVFTVSPGCNLMEIKHFVHIETNYDGCNVTIDEIVVPPFEGYDATISTSTSYYAYCVDLEEGFTGNGFSGVSRTWGKSCFDLEPWMGMTIRVRFDFGSDSSVAYPGWYLAYVKIGSGSPINNEQSTWGSLKSLYR